MNSRTFKEAQYVAYYDNVLYCIVLYMFLENKVTRVGFSVVEN